MSNEDTTAGIACMKAGEKIMTISKSPMPLAEKEKEYAKIEAETGVKAAELLAGQGGPPQDHLNNSGFDVRQTLVLSEKSH